MQGGERAMEKAFLAMKASVVASTAATKEPKIEDGRQLTDQCEATPRVRHLHIMVNEVVETPMNGGRMTTVRRDRPQIFYVSSSKEDASAVLEAVADAQEDREQEAFEKVKFYGIGKPGIQQLQTYINERTLRRARATRAAETLDESQDTIPDDIAWSLIAD
jgi:hypothetical protein